MSVDDFLCTVSAAEADLDPQLYEYLLCELTDRIWEVLNPVYDGRREAARRERERERRNLNTPALATTVAKAVLNGTTEEHRQAVEAVLDALGAVAEIRWRRGALRDLGIDPDEFLVSGIPSKT